MVKILGISGKKQSGKNTAANHIHGCALVESGLIKGFYINNDGGGLAILTADRTGVEDYGILDVTRQDEEFISYAEREIWPHIKMYSFANGLKNICIDFFGITHNQVYGTDKQKNQEVPHLLWENMLLNPLTQAEGVGGQLKTGPMTAREFMQYFGTDIMRKIYEPVHVNHTVNRILAEQTQLAIIPDVRFPNEVKAIQDVGGKVVRLTRSNHEDTHSSECGLDPENFDWDQFDLVIENDGSLQDTLEDVHKMYTSLVTTGKLC
jgi:hypothetical protein